MSKISNIKGITLISLVITIIILLLLAGVSIATLTGKNGILTQANTAKERTQRAEIIERAKTDILGEQARNKGQITQKDVNTIIANYDKEKKIREDKEEAYIITEKGYEIKVSEIWKSIGEILAKDVLKIDVTATEEAAKSPYVKYNGLDCRVLYHDDTHGIQIITSGSVEDVTLGYGDTMVTASDFSYDGTASINNSVKKAAASYNNVVDNLNKRAKNYMDEKGIATDARCYGSISIVTSDTKFQDDTTTQMWSGTEPYLTTYSWNNKFKKDDTNYLEDVNQVKDLGLNSNSEIWLASRNIMSGSGYTYFIVRDNSSINLYKNYFCDVSATGSSSGRTVSHGFRPIFLLSPDVVISSGDGSSQNPYVIES